MALLYLTIWAALALFVAGEWGRALHPARAGTGWPWWSFTTGLVFALIHTVLAFALVHDWSHAQAVSTTAAQTAAVFGSAFGGGVYVNYAFFGVWAADAAVRRFASQRHARGRGWLLWTVRAFYMVIVFNAGVVFAVSERRALGIAVTAALAAAWAHDLTGARVSQRPQ